MPLPFLNATEQSIDMTTQFGGYNHQLNLSENEFYDMKNMSSRNFPMASTRKKRGLFSNGMLKKANALVSKDSIVYSYTGQGDIGVTLVDSLKDNPWVEPPVIAEEEDVKEAGITKVAPCYRTDLTNSILGTYHQLNNFDRYIYSNGNMTFESSIKGGVVDANYVWIVWEHEKIPKGTLWAKELFVISHYYTLYKNRASAKDNDFIKRPSNRNKLKGHKVWVGDRELTVKEIRRRDQLQEITTLDDWTIIFEEDIGTWIENKPLYVRLTDPIPEDIPEGKYTIKDIMKKRNIPVNINASVDELLNLVLDQNFVPVTDDRGVFIGIVTRRDIINSFCEIYKNENFDEIK